MAPASSARTSTACGIYGNPSATNSSPSPRWKPAKKFSSTSRFNPSPSENTTSAFEPEIVAKIARTSARLYEVISSYHGMQREQGGKEIGFSSVGIKQVPEKAISHSYQYFYGFLPSKNMLTEQTTTQFASHGVTTTQRQHYQTSVFSLCFDSLAPSRIAPPVALFPACLGARLWRIFYYGSIVSG